MGLGPSPQPGMALGPRGPCELCRKPMQAGCWCGYLSVSGDKLISPPAAPHSVSLGKDPCFQSLHPEGISGNHFWWERDPWFAPCI